MATPCQAKKRVAPYSYTIYEVLMATPAWTRFSAWNAGPAPPEEPNARLDLFPSMVSHGAASRRSRSEWATAITARRPPPRALSRQNWARPSLRLVWTAAEAACTNAPRSHREPLLGLAHLPFCPPRLVIPWTEARPGGQVVLVRKPAHVRPNFGTRGLSAT
jgi:hypothetical protein